MPPIISGVDSLAKLGPINGFAALIGWSGDFQRQAIRRSLALVGSICISGE